jgi:large subunit ribosomal protein L14|uniref:Ribosomal protein L14 n=1 Tax=Heterosigma akashiwo TaxID=2829 RepID=D2Z272_HETAK|nr:ribosomal protein L14 [Heterosigma akashiwo]ACS27141.1 ribosomal protein L14 [Heterosigma akashiwo]ACS27180.1 ribosomal protein L14 [Heterosigma akashiwo]AOT84808.1 ribosomal protein large subunit 14 [Heterosigma akashiwo]AOT84850.1 ribosomal protein large subunit 14 [Heterosigma akashiwo]BAI70636.1 ribosomal protein L14 [Heterosigma akashiwo]|mmetsp:Transcript_46133/g.67363  ORF Transcript_46133/g.67363 Transcript_46133/m.67363 type:complete len:127 (-) Transcript_46133:619-999(-)
MIQAQTLVNIADNSGSKLGRCIRVGQGYQNRWSSCGELILISVQKLRKKRKFKPKVQKGEVVRGVVLRTKAKFRRKNSNFVQFHENAIALVNAQLRPLGTRVLGPVTRELRNTKFMKVASLSGGFV